VLAAGSAADRCYAATASYCSCSARALRAAHRAPVGLPATTWMLELGALALGTETELVLKSRRVVPGRLLAAGFDFEFPEWPAAARDLCSRWRASRLVA
jgi:uncharacterized protein